MNKNELKEEIFTIGDKTTLGIITCFRLLDNEIMVDFDNKNSILLKSKQLQHVKQKLFTTEDGVDIINPEQICWAVYKFCDEIIGNNADYLNNFAVSSLKFSTKEKAEEFIILNKPVLSLTDIKNNSNITIGGMKSLTELVKSKLK